MRSVLLLLAVATIKAQTWSSNSHLSKGADFIANRAFTADLATAKLDATSTLLCYNDVANNQYSTCAVVLSTGTALSQPGPDLIVSETTSKDVAVAAFGSHSAVVCYFDIPGDKLECRALVRTGFILEAGSAFAVKGHTVSDVSVGALDSEFAILCYSDWLHNRRGTCNVLGLSAAVRLLYEGPDFILNQGSTQSLSVVPHSSTTALGCFVDVTTAGGSLDAWYGGCKALTRTASILSSGTVIEVTRGQAKSISVAPFDSTKSVACYRDGSIGFQGMCNLLTLTGSTLSKGPAVLVNAGSTEYPRVAALDSNTAVMCYEDRSTYTAKYGGCSTVTISPGGSSLVKNGNGLRYDALVNSGGTSFPTVAGLSSSAGVVCYRDDAANHYGTCTALSYSAPPTRAPTPQPTRSPTSQPTRMPTASPTKYPTPHPTVVAPGEASAGRPHNVRVPHITVEERFVLSADIVVHWTATSGLDAQVTSHASDWVGLYKAGDCAQNRNVATTNVDQNNCYIALEGVPAGRRHGTTTFTYSTLKWPAGKYEARYFLGDSSYGNGNVCRDLDNTNGAVQNCALEAAATSSVFHVVPWSPGLVTRTPPGTY